MKTHRVRRSGFTFIETIVTVGLIAVLAALIVPTVIQKAQASDPVKVSSDLQSISTGLQTFIDDTKSGFPNLLWSLTARPTIVNHEVDSVTVLTANEVAAWNGPYISATISGIASDSIPTGYTGSIINYLQRYDALMDTGELDPNTGATASFNPVHPLFVAIRIDGLTVAQANTINTIIDGPDDPNIAAGPNAGANSTGHFRFGLPTNGVVRAFYLAVPITH